MIHSNNFFKVRPASSMVGFLVLACFSISSCFSSERKVANQPVVKVNESTLSAKDFADTLANKLKALDALTVKHKTTVERAKQEVIRDFIVKVITTDWAKKNSLLVTRSQLENEMNKIRGFYPDDLAFRRALTEENLSFEDWRERVKFSLLEKMVVNHLHQRIEPPTESELKTYYKAHKDDFRRDSMIRLRQIVLENENDAKRIKSELRKGKKLSDLAKNFSITPEGKNGGDIGWIHKGTLDIFDRAFSMRIGRLSGILKSPYGYHIYELTEKRSSRTLRFEEAKSEIVRTLMGQREQAVYSAWLEEQIRVSKIYKDEVLIENIEVETRG